ncbi:MAG: hypothetical protein AB1861_15995 [Cyanobacteriota bacterium]
MADRSVLTFTRAAESEALSLLLLIQSRTGRVEVKSGWKMSLLLSLQVTV